MKKIKVGERLLSQAEFVRQGAYFADIGTDHAHLPIFLLGEGKITRAVCADINKGPLDTARKNAKEYGCQDSLSFVLTDGALGLSNMGITDYAICGMGGELIIDIIEKAPHFMREGIRLILQPMSRQNTLREYLARRGFSIVGENYSFDTGKYYLTLAAEYTGEVRKISAFEAEFGNVDKNTPIYHAMKGYFENKIKALKKASSGKALGGDEKSPEYSLLLEYYERMNIKNDG